MISPLDVFSARRYLLSCRLLHLTIHPVVPSSSFDDPSCRLLRSIPPARLLHSNQSSSSVDSEKDWGISLLDQKVSESGTNEDGSTWYRESGEELGDNGYRCHWAEMGGKSPDGSSEWKETWWEKSDWTGYKELGAEKSGKNAEGDSWWETWKEGIAAVDGALSRNLADLQEREGSYLSIYDQPSTSLVAQDPIISLIHASVDKLTHSTNFLQYLGQHALIVQADAPTSEEADQVADEKYHFMSLLLNLASTYLYMVNTYIIVPTADDYSVSLGAAATVCGVVIGSMAVAQVFSSIYFIAWSNKSYFRPLVFRSTMLVLGNILYALAYNLDSLTILLIGSLLCGMGSARVVNRRYISDCVPLKICMQASAGFVSASALGMACGPALAGLLQTNF
ncbi:hypothetical protein Cni_G26198 [Canna indica]|uniref:Uncharacterized protein n=1 Tax=Canna indica TaxID=4628 RepID=A0AAQ3QLS2_9LILI|nr:hypothetical protein Cni_G26198 [Canna indica]